MRCLRRVSEDEDVFPYLYWGMLAQNHKGHQSHSFAIYNGSIEIYRVRPDEIAEVLGADGINYLPIEEYVKATGMSQDELCLGCVTGEYPTQMANILSCDMKNFIERGEKENGRTYE